jgi:hypothetical protein
LFSSQKNPTLLQSSESYTAGGPAESGGTNVAAGPHQARELVAHLGLGRLHLNSQGYNVLEWGVKGFKENLESKVFFIHFVKFK